MDPVRLVLIAVGGAQLALAVGFVARAPWATALWPLPDTPLSYSFIGAILAGGAGPLILTGLTGAVSGLVGYALSFGLMYGSMAVAALVLQGSAPGMLAFAAVLGALAIACGLLWVESRRRVPRDERATPSLLRWAFAVELAVLFGVGVLLVAGVPNTLPWDLSSESSLLYGLVFIGLGIYYLYAVVRPKWRYAAGPLLGFLLYDLALAGPLFARFSSVRPEHVRGQVTASAIILVSAVLGVYFLFVDRTTRIWPLSSTPPDAVAEP